jgi:hypothetical protein
VGVALLAVGDRELGLEAVVLVAQALVLGAQRLEALAQRGLGRALPRGDAVDLFRCAVAQPLDLRAQRGLRVEPLARDAGPMPRQPAKALVVRVAEFLADDRGKRAAGRLAGTEPGSRRGRVSDEQLDRWAAGASPVAVVRMAEPLGVRRALTADHGASRAGTA